MIVSKIKNLDLYKDIIPNYKEIQNLNFKNLTNGVHQLKDENFIVVIERELSENDLYESHKKFIDIHVPITLVETFKYISYDNYKISKEYTVKDEASLGYATKDESVIKIPPGEVIIFLPGEPHIPLLGQNKKVQRKAIIKVLWKR